MFPDGMPDLQSLMSQAAEMQRKVVAAQQELAETRVRRHGRRWSRHRDRDGHG